MRRRYFQFIAAVAITVIALAPAFLTAQQTPRQLFERAKIVEEANTDLPQAIRLYEQAIAQSKDRALTAEALLRVGGCYEKLGSAEARKAYEEIESKYKDQTGQVLQARQRLVALVARAASPTGTLTDRLLWTVPAPSRLMPITPDGLWIGTSTPASGAIRNASTGEVKLVIDGADGPLVSPDGKTIVYNFHGTDSLRSNDATTGQLRVMGTDPGSKPRVLVSSPEIRYSNPVAWALNGKSVLLELTKQDGTWQIGWVSIVDGSIQVLKSLDWRLNGLTTQYASLSPDGRYIAYSVLASNPKTRYRDFADSNAQDIYIMTADGMSEKVLTKTGGINEGPVWTPDGTRILFTSDRSGTFDLYSVAMREGEAAGFPSLVKKNVGRIIPVNTMTKPGTFYYLAKPPNEVHIGEMDPNTLKFRGFAAGVAESFIGMRPAWSPDGSSIAFTRPREDLDAYDLVVQTLKTGSARVYPSLDLNNVPLKQIVEWFHDGKALFLALNSKTGLGLNRIDLNSGSIHGIKLSDKPILLVSGIGALSADDKTIYLRNLNSKKDETTGIIKVDPSRFDHITRFELHSTPGDPIQISMKPIALPVEGREGVASGDPQQPGYLVSDGVSDLALSPDGQTLALMTSPNPKTNEVYLARVASSDGREYRKLYGPFRSDDLGNKIAWTADGRTILFAMSDSNDRWKIMRIPVDGGNPEFTGLEVDRLRNFDVSPDGSRIAFEVGADPNWEVRALDYISSNSKTGR